MNAVACRLTLALAGLTLLAAHIWTRNGTWRIVAPEAPLLLLVFPAFALLGRPWSVSHGRPPPPWLATGTLVLVLAGVATDGTLLLAAAWACLLRIALEGAGVRTAHPAPTALYVLVVAGFPWLATDLAGLAWPFRTSAAWAVATVLGGAGLDAQAHGPIVHLGGRALSVDASCSGFGLLQACLLPAALLQALPRSPRWSPVTLLALVIALAWVSNLIRVVALGAVAVTLGFDAARGALHTLIGLVVVGLPAMVLAALLLPRAPGAIARAP